MAGGRKPGILVFGAAGVLLLCGFACFRPDTAPSGKTTTAEADAQASTPVVPAVPPILPAAPTGTVNADNPGVVEIPDVTPYTQVAALSDNHGMYENTNRLLQAAHLMDATGNWSGGKTLLLVVGDMIDKGPKSLEILDLYIRLTAQAPAQGGRVVCLLGNHEAEFLADPDNSKAVPLRAEMRAQDVALPLVAQADGPRGKFLRGLPLAARVGGRWLFCHAGWPPDMGWNAFAARAKSVLQAGNYADPLLSDPDSILEKRKWWDDDSEVAALEARLDKDGLFGVVFGHQPLAFGIAGDVGPRSREDHRLVKIDCGMAPEAGAHPGKILVFSQPQELTFALPPTHMTSIGP